MIFRRIVLCKRVLVMPLIALTLLTSSCRRVEYAVGDEVSFDEWISVYLKVGDGKSYVMEQKLVDLLVSEPEWFASPGIEIIEKSLEAKAADATWFDDGAMCSAKGMCLQVKGKIKVQKDCSKGLHQLFLLLPHLNALTSEISVVPMMVSDRGGRLAHSLHNVAHGPVPQVSNICILPIRDFYVYEDARGAKWAHSKSVILGIGIIIGLFIVGGIVGSWVD